MCGKIVKGKKSGFEMFHGMDKTGKNVWKGRRMKHPEMPRFMTFNGTVTRTGNTMSVKGCAIGAVFCDSERWTRMR